MTRYRWALLGAFLLVWGWSAWQPKDQTDWLLENIIVFIAVPVIFFAGRYFRLSDLSYTLITIFLCVHAVGAHYTYAEVPFGFTLQQWLGSSRNQYDRLIHFSFGFLLAYPAREAFLRLVRVRGFWGYYLPFDLVVAASAAFEIAEWIIAINVSPTAGTAYLGTQGDEWDAQKDTFCAGVGALLAMFIIALIHWYYRGREFWRELLDSFRIPSGDHPLGEEALEDLRSGRPVP